MYQAHGGVRELVLLEEVYGTCVLAMRGGWRWLDLDYYFVDDELARSHHQGEESKCKVDRGLKPTQSSSHSIYD